MHPAASVCRQVGKVVACCAAMLSIALHTSADSLQTLNDENILGYVTLKRGSDGVTITPEKGDPTTAKLEDIDSVSFGDSQAIFSGDMLLINNDMGLRNVAKTKNIKLRAGLHRFVIPYWQGAGQHSLATSVMGPGISGQQPLGNGNMVCFRSKTDKHEPSAGIDKEGYRLPELPLKTASNIRKMQERCEYRIYAGDPEAVFKNVGVLNTIPLQQQGRTDDISTGIVHSPTTNFGMVFEGFFVAREDGTYTFGLQSDDGSQLYLGEAANFMADALGSTPIDAPWQIELSRKGLILGQLKTIANDKARLHMPLVSDIELSLNHINAVWDKRVDLNTIDRSKEQPGQDTVYIRDKNDPVKIISVSGKLLSLDNEALSFDFRGSARKITRDRLAGLVLNHTDRLKPEDPGLYQVLRLRGGHVVPCKVIEIDKQARFKILGGSEVAPPREVLVSMRSENGRRVDLTRREPTAEEAIPYFGLKLPHRVNRSFSDSPIKLYDAKTYERGLAVHSKSRLHYKLDRPAERFKATFGLMEPGGRLGNVTARVLGDGKVLWEQADITAESTAIEVNVALKGVERLVLEVDFGQGQSVGDRAAWCNPQVIYAASK